MTGIVLLDVALGVIYVFLVFSLIASAIQEALAGFFRWRAEALKAGVEQMLGDEFDKIWNSSVIDILKGPSFLFRNKTKRRDPSYIQSSHFARAVLEELDLAGQTPAEIVNKINTKEGRVYKWLRATLRNAGDTAEAAEAAIAGYFDEVMERVSGWYVRRAKFSLVIIGFFLAALTNFNVFDYTSTLIRDKDTRDAAVANAMQAAAFQSLDDLKDNLGVGDLSEEVSLTFSELRDFYTVQKDVLTEQTSALGWSCGDQNRFACFYGVLTRGYPLLSWVLMSLAVMLGAQFWFDMLQNVVSVRSAGVKLVSKTRELTTDAS